MTTQQTPPPAGDDNAKNNATNNNAAGAENRFAPPPDDFFARAQECLKNSPFAQVGDDLKKTARALCETMLGQMDVVSRAEFDAQAKLLAEATAKLETLQAQLNQMQGREKQVWAGLTARSISGNPQVWVRFQGGRVVLAKKCWYHGHIEVIQETLNILRKEHPDLDKAVGFSFSGTSTDNRSSGFADSCKEGNRQYAACRNRGKSIEKDALRKILSIKEFPEAERPDILKEVKRLREEAKDAKNEKILPEGYKGCLAFETREECVKWAKGMGLNVMD